MKNWREDKLITRINPAAPEIVSYINDPPLAGLHREQFTPCVNLEYFLTNRREGHFFPEDFIRAREREYASLTYVGSIHGVLVKGKDYDKIGWMDLYDYLERKDPEVLRIYKEKVEQENLADHPNIFCIKFFETKGKIKDTIIMRIKTELEYAITCYAHECVPYIAGEDVTPEERQPFVVVGKKTEERVTRSE